MKLYSDNIAAPEKFHFGREYVLAHHAYDTPPQPSWCPDNHPMKFTNPTLHLAASCIREFLNSETSSDVEKKVWYNIPVQKSLFQFFYETILKHNIVMLPFWCWCDGCHYQEVHRHMIVVVPKTACPVLEKTYFVIPILTAHDLLFNIIVLSGRISFCCTPTHFFINYSLPKFAAYILASLWEGGIENYMVLLQGTLPETLLYNTIPFHAKKVDDQWQVAAKTFPCMPTELVLPVPRHFKPTSQETDCVLYFLRERKLYFETDESLASLDDKAWMSIQASKGNLFERLIENDWWIPNDRLQIGLSKMELIVTTYTLFDEKLSDMVKEMTTLNRRLDRYLVEHSDPKNMSLYVGERWVTKNFENYRPQNILREKLANYERQWQTIRNLWEACRIKMKCLKGVRVENHNLDDGSSSDESIPDSIPECQVN